MLHSFLRESTLGPVHIGLMKLNPKGEKLEVDEILMESYYIIFGVLMIILSNDIGL